MPKVRSIQSKAIHKTLFRAAQDWSSLNARTLLRYAFHQGIKHALSIEHTQDAQLLLLHFFFGPVRPRFSNSVMPSVLIKQLTPFSSVDLFIIN